jgi:hypothetical protein
VLHDICLRYLKECLVEKNPCMFRSHEKKREPDMRTKDELKQDYLDEFASQRVKVGGMIFPVQLNATRFRKLVREERALQDVAERELVDEGLMTIENNTSLAGFRLTQLGYDTIYTTTAKQAEDHITKLIFERFASLTAKAGEGFALMDLTRNDFLKNLNPKEETYIQHTLDELQKSGRISLKERAVGVWIVRN